MIGRPTRWAALASASALVAACSSVSSAPREPDARPLLSTDECAQLVVLGARGSSQDPAKNRGVGPEVRRTVEQLARRVHARSDATVRLEAVRYDARSGTLDAYQAHVADGATMMGERLRGLQRSCPSSRVALVGFSQGAQVVHAVAIDLPRSVARRVPLVAMIADPRHDPADQITQWGYGAKPVEGSGRLGPGTPIDDDVRRAAISLCVEGDEICNNPGGPGRPPSATHRHFYEKASTARETALQLDRVLRRNGT